MQTARCRPSNSAMRVTGPPCPRRPRGLAGPAPLLFICLQGKEIIDFKKAEDRPGAASGWEVGDGVFNDGSYFLLHVETEV